MSSLLVHRTTERSVTVKRVSSHDVSTHLTSQTNHINFKMPNNHHTSVHLTWFREYFLKDIMMSPVKHQCLFQKAFARVESSPLFEQTDTKSLEMHITRQLLHINNTQEPINHYGINI